jgi:site-specific recombinase XerD
MAVLTDNATGRKRSPVTFPEYRLGKTPPNAGHTFPAEVLTPDECARLINACARRGPSGIRNRALLVVMWRAGLRVSEALALAPKDVDAALGSVTVLHGKGDKRRAVGMDPAAFAVVERWRDVRSQLRVARGAPLFCTIADDGWGPIGRPMRPAYVRQMMKRLGARAGIEKRVHPHGLRHTHAFELSLEGVPLPLIQRQLGHSSLATTARYVDHLAPAQVVAAMQTRTWEASA